MKKKELMQAIFTSLEYEFGTFNFKSNSKNEFFFREDETALFMFDILPYDHIIPKTGEKVFLIEPKIWINVKKIEEIYKEITVNTYLKKTSDFLTLGNDLANLESNPDGINRIRNQSLGLMASEESHVPYIRQELIKHFKDFAFPYFIKNGTVKAVDLLLNEHPNDYCVHMKNDGLRFIKGIIAAKLNNNPSLNDILKIYEGKIKEWDMPKNIVEEMDKLKAILPMIGTKIKI
jgi:hypothetical protein